MVEVKTLQTAMRVFGEPKKPRRGRPRAKPQVPRLDPGNRPGKLTKMADWYRPKASAGDRDGDGPPDKDEDI